MNGDDVTHRPPDGDRAGETPIDFRALDPTTDAAWLRAEISRIMRDDRVARSPSVARVLTVWTSRALIAAVVVLAVSAAAALHTPASAPPTTAEILGIPRPLVKLATTTRRATMSDLAQALNTGTPYAR